MNRKVALVFLALRQTRRFGNTFLSSLIHIFAKTFLIKLFCTIFIFLIFSVNLQARYDYNNQTFLIEGAIKNYASMSSDNGGVFLIGNAVGIFRSSVNFTSNRVTGGLPRGGVIYVSNSSLTFHLNVVFASNLSAGNGEGRPGATAYGGAVYAAAKTQMFFYKDVSFTGNKVSGGSGIGDVDVGGNGGYAYGGAIFFDNVSTINFKGRADFTSNSSESGGGGYGYGEGTGGHAFHAYAGAMYINASNLIVFDGAANFISNSVRAGRGGDAFAGRDLNGDGGNGGSAYGGALYLTGASKIVFNSMTTFKGNSAYGGNGGDADSKGTSYGNGGNGGSAYGGAMFLTGSSKMEFRGDAAIVGNISRLGAAGRYQGYYGTYGATGEEYGGAVYLENSSLEFYGRSTIISTNSSRHGGAIYAKGNSVIRFSGVDVEISYNNSGASDGVFTMDGATKLFFENTGILKAVGNTSNTGGFLILASRSLTIPARIYFVKNAARANGGALYMDRTKTEFLLGGQISSNSASNGAAFFAASNSTLSFAGGSVEISYNNSPSGNGVLYAKNSTLNFDDNADLLAKQNISNNGGFLFLDAGLSTRFNAAVALDSNTAKTNGGAVYVSASRAVFNKSFTAIHNHAQNGGTFYLINNSTLEFSGAVEAIGNNSVQNGGFLFQNTKTFVYMSGSFSAKFNQSQKDGGAVYAIEFSTFLFSGQNIVFEGNKAKEGGAIKADNNVKIILKADSGYFKDNYAEAGGAISGRGTSAFDIYNIDFIANIAKSSGGAIYLNGTAKGIKMNIYATERSIVFRDNEAANFANDIYLEGYSTVSFIVAKGRSVSLQSGVRVSTFSKLIKEGEGDLILEGENNFGGKFEARGGRIVVVGENINLGKIIIGRQAGIKISAKEENEKNIVYAEDIFIDGTLEISADNFTGVADKFVGRSSASVTLSSNSKLIVKNSGIGRIESIVISGIKSGRFSEVETGPNTNIEVRYFDDKASIISYRWTDLEYVGGNTANQKTSGSMLDLISKNYFSMSPQMHKMINEIDSLDDISKREVLESLSGTFMVNVLNMQILDKNNPIIFNRLSLYLKDSRKGAWAFGRFGATDVNLKETQFAKRFNQTKNGTVFGYDIFNNEANTFLMGAYGVYDFIEARQLQDRGEIENFELGFYGVKSVKLWQRPINFLINFSFGHQEYNLIRQVSAGRYSFSPRANFSSKSLKINLETEFAFAIERKLYLKPFIGLQGGILFNESFSENSGQPASLDVESGNNYRVRVVAGLGVENKYERIIWNMRIYAAEVLAEHAAKINVKFLDSKFLNSNEIVSEREYFLAGAQGSFNYLVGKNILASLNGSVEYGQDLFSYYGGIGFSYKFKGLERTEITGDVFDNAYLLFVQKKYLKAAEILNGLLNDINHQEDAKDILEKIERQVNKDAKDEEALDFSELTYAKGYISYQTGDLAEAVLQWKKFLEFSQDKRDVVEYMARSERTLNRQLQDSYENKAAVIFEKGIKNFNNGQWVECIKTMEKLQSYVNKNKFAQSAYYNSCAKEYIRKSIAQLAKLKDTAAHRENDKTENAVNAPAHNEAAHIDENGAQEKYNEGLELYAQGRYMQAQRAWEQALRLNPNHTKAKVALASLKDEQE